MFVPYSYFSSYIFVLYMHLFMFFSAFIFYPLWVDLLHHRTSRQGSHCQHFRLQVFGFFGTPMAEALRKSQHGEHLNAMKVGSEKLWSGATWESPLNQFMPGGTGKVWPFTDSCRKMGANYAETQGGKILGMGGLIQVHLKKWEARHSRGWVLLYIYFIKDEVYQFHNTKICRFQEKSFWSSIWDILSSPHCGGCKAHPLGSSWSGAYAMAR